LNEDGSLVEEGEGKLIPGTKPIGTVKALATVKSLLEKAAA
jgi:hypothetical protein